MASQPIPSRRALMISNGLVMIGLAGSPTRVDNFIRLDAERGGSYWVAYDGSRLLWGETLADAEELQPKFVERMVRAAR